MGIKRQNFRTTVGRATRVVFEIEGWPSLQPLCFLSLRFFFEILGLTTGYDLWQMMCLKFLQWGSAPPAVALAKIFGSFFQTLNRKLFFRFLYLKNHSNLNPIDSVRTIFLFDSEWQKKSFFHFFVSGRLTFFAICRGWSTAFTVLPGDSHLIFSHFFSFCCWHLTYFFLFFLFFFFFHLIFLILSYFVSFFLIESHFDLFCLILSLFDLKRDKNVFK